MLSEKITSVPTETPGVYCLFDLDGVPAYAGQSSKLRSRLRQHFVRQDSSVVSYGRLDIWDIAYIDWWETSERDRAEQLLLSHYTPYLNFDHEIEGVQNASSIDVDDPDGVIQLVSEDEREFRSEPYNRTKQKLEHLSRMVDKIRLAGHSDDTKRTLYEHHRILQENITEFLGVEDFEQREVGDWSDK